MSKSHSFIIDGNKISYGSEAPSRDQFLSSYYVGDRVSYFSLELVKAIKEVLSKVYYISAERGIFRGAMKQGLRSILGLVGGESIL